MKAITLDSTSLVGLQLELPNSCPSCGNNIAIIGSSRGPHAGSLACAGCDRFRCWMPRAAADFINQIIDEFGRPTAPIVVRCTDTDGCTS